MNIKRKIFEHLVDTSARWGHLPSQSEVCQAFAGLCDDVGLHLEQLEREGLIRLGRDGQSSIALVPTYQPPLEVPWLGQARVDEGEYGEQRHGFLRLDLGGLKLPSSEELVALHVPDDAMIDAGVLCGDLAIIRARPPESGDIVVFEREGQVYFRRFFILSGIPHLLAENARSPELCPAWEVTFQGVLWGVVRLQDLASTRSAQASKINYLARDDSPPSTRTSQRPAQCPSERSGRARSYTARAVQSADWIEPEADSPPRRIKKKGSLKLSKPPQRVGLNEMKRPAYGSAKERSMIDERPEVAYAWPLYSALKELDERG